MHKLILVWLMGAAVLALAPLDTGHARPADEQAVGADARIAQIQAVLDDEDEGLLDDDEQDEPEGQGDVEDDEDQENETGSSGEWEAPI
jgi:ATP-dependent exoDNAse (exonuclease V) alpha subunit